MHICVRMYMQIVSNKWLTFSNKFCILPFGVQEGHWLSHILEKIRTMDHFGVNTVQCSLVEMKVGAVKMLNNWQ